MELTGGKKKCALNINVKCLTKEIVTNKKQRLFITKGAMERLFIICKAFYQKICCNTQIYS